MASPTQIFKYADYVTKNSQGNYSFVSQSRADYIIQDYSDPGQIDDLTQLGDINSDHFNLLINRNTVPSVYLRKTSTGIVEKDELFGANAGYFLLTNTTNFDGMASNVPYDIPCYCPAL